MIDLSGVNVTEAKLLYFLHWIILDAAEECADSDYGNGVYQHSPYYYVFPITSIMVSMHILLRVRRCWGLNSPLPFPPVSKLILHKSFIMFWGIL